MVNRAVKNLLEKKNWVWFCFHAGCYKENIAGEEKLVVHLMTEEKRTFLGLEICHRCPEKYIVPEECSICEHYTSCVLFYYLLVFCKNPLKKRFYKT